MIASVMRIKARWLYLAAVLASLSLAPVAGAASRNLGAAWSAHVSGAWSRPILLGHGRAVDALGNPTYDASVGPRGRWVAGWIARPSNGSEQIRIARGGQRGRGAIATTFYTADRHHLIEGLRVAIDGTGEIIAAFTDVTLDVRGAEIDSVIKAVVRSSNDRLLSIQDISPADSEQPALALAPSGEAVVVFQRDVPFAHPIDQATQTSTPDLVMAAIRRPGQPFEPASVISAPAVPMSPALALPTQELHPAVVIADNGAAVAAWTRAVDPSGGSAVETSVRPAGGTFGAVQQLGAGDTLQLASDSAGDTTVAWSGSAPDGSSQLQASHRPAGGAFTPAQTLSTALVGESEDPGFSTAVGPGRLATVAWVADNDSCAGGALRRSTSAVTGTFTPAKPIWTPHLGGEPVRPAATDPAVVSLGRLGLLATWFEIFPDPDTGPDHDSCGLDAQRGMWSAAGANAFGPLRHTPLSQLPFPGPVVVGSPAGVAVSVWPKDDGELMATTFRP